MRLAAASICVTVNGSGISFADGRIEEILDRVELDVAPGQHPRQHFRKLMALRDRQRPRGTTGIEPIAPQLSGQTNASRQERRAVVNGER